MSSGILVYPPLFGPAATQVKGYPGATYQVVWSRGHGNCPPTGLQRGVFLISSVRFLCGASAGSLPDVVFTQSHPRWVWLQAQSKV